MTQNDLPFQTRRASFAAIRPELPAREREALALLRRFPAGATAEEVALAAGKESSFYRPRLTMMEKRGMISVIGIKVSPRTGRAVSVYMAPKEAQ